MSKKRFIDTKIWSDAWINNLDPVEKLLFLYLLTNEKTNVAGIYELPIKIMAVETGIEKEMIDKILIRFEQDKKIIYKNGWIIIINFIKHQNFNNEKIKKGIELAIENIPDEIKNSLSMGHIYPIDVSYMGHTYPIDVSSMSHGCLLNNSDSDSDSDSNKNISLSKERDVSKKENPIKDIIPFYISLVKERTSIDLEVSWGAVGKRIKHLLTRKTNSWTLEGIKEFLVWFVDTDKAKDNGYAMTTALSDHSLNQYKLSKNLNPDLYV
jgi:hypothetical protein